MNRKAKGAMLQAPLLLLALNAGLEAREPPDLQQGPAATAEAVVRGLYKLVTFEAGNTPDWDEVRSLFLEEAVISLRTTRTASTVFSVDGFVQDFVSFIQRANVRQTGFSERVVRLESMVFRDIAHVLVLYEVSVPGSQRPPQLGVDSFQLVRREGRWWIASIVNDVPNAEHPVPPALRAADSRR